MFPSAIISFSFTSTTAGQVVPTKPKIKDYLHTLQLNHNPFGTPTAELELQIKSETSPFFSYFVNLHSTQSGRPLLDELRQNNHTILYGTAGSGKTTFYLNLESQCRAIPDQTLVISHTIGKSEAIETNTDIPWDTLTQSLAVDLFVQATEQFHRLKSSAITHHLSELAAFWNHYIPQFNRTLRSFLKEDLKSHPKGLPIWWLDRPAVRYTSVEPDLYNFWKALQTSPLSHSALTASDGFWQGITLAKALGYQRFYLLVDVVDAPRRQKQDLYQQLLPLFDLFQLTTTQPIYLKFFLPMHWLAKIEMMNLLPNQIPSFIIEWCNSTDLQQLITHRFRSAGSWIESLNALASQEFAGQLENQLIQQANGSPRRLLQLIYALLDNHARRDPTDPTITLSDWQKTRQAFVLPSG